MSWIVVVLGLAAQPTFHPEPSYSDCMRRVTHVNEHYGKMVRARCVYYTEAVKLGYNPKGMK